MQSYSSTSSAERLQYLDFELEIGPESGRDYSVMLVRSPAGEAQDIMHFPIEELELERYLQALHVALSRSGGRRRQTSREEQAVQDFGQALFDALMTSEVRSRYYVSQEIAAQRNLGLRLKLRIRPLELAALPWELLYDPRQAEYICLSRNTPIVRYLELPQAVRPLIVTPPLRILGMIASPQDLPPLDVTREQRRVEEAIKDLLTRGLVEVSWLKDQTWRDLQRAMSGGPWHVFHFIGHGGFDRRADEGFIALTDTQGATHRLSATQLGRLLADHRSLRLVLLDVCEGARVSEQHNFAGTAAILVRRGIPAVLAMQYEITDQAARELASTFYESLANGMPVDAAVTEARKAISLALFNTVEWGVPVLYMRSPDGLLFSIQKQETMDKAQAEGDLFSLIETAQRFFQAAGFELISKEKENTFFYQPKGKTWQQKLSERVAVAVVSGKPLDGETVRALCQSTKHSLGDKPIILVVIDRTPTDSGWLQIGTMRAEDIQVIPVDDTVLFDGQERGRQRHTLEKHLRRFLGREQDLYNVRHPVADRLNFFGREALAKDLIEYLIEGRPMALFGLRKMGKSSLLMYLRDKFPFPTALVDSQAGVELNGLYKRILTSWSRSVRVKASDLDWSPPDLGVSDPSAAFTEASRQLLLLLEDHALSPRLCLLVDEADLIVPHNEEVLDSYLAFARALRGLVQEEEGRFSLLMTGVDPLFNRVNRLAGQQNPLYQFFREIYLPALERDDCIQMIRNIGRQMGLVYKDEAVAFVADVSGGHPFLARQLCSLAFQRLSRRGDVPLTHLQETASRFIREPGTSELLDEKGLWGEISSPDLWPQPQVVENQAVLKSLAETEPQPELELVKRAQDRRACERSLDELEQRAVLSKPKQSLFNIRLRLFRNWIRRYQLGEE
jgi:CHAT domain-containing protein